MVTQGKIRRRAAIRPPRPRRAMNTIAAKCTANVKKKRGWLAACNTLASETRPRTTKLTPRSRPGRRCRNIETPPRRRRRRASTTLRSTYAEIPHCFWALRFFLSFFRTSDNVRSFHVLFWSLQGLRGSISVKAVRMAPKSKKKPPTTSSGGHESYQ